MLMCGLNHVNENINRQCFVTLLLLVKKPTSEGKKVGVIILDIQKLGYMQTEKLYYLSQF